MTLLVASVQQVSAQSFKILYNFTANQANPAALILSGQTLYGITKPLTIFTGTNYGTVYTVNTDGTGYNILHTFSVVDGEYPDGLVLSGNTLYGTTEYEGGSNYNGTVFTVKIDGMGFNTLSTFLKFHAVGWSPQRGVIQSGNTLYGTTSRGGADDMGTIFSVNTDGTGYNTLYAFLHESTYANIGSLDLGKLLISSNTIYGTAGAGGTNGAGTIFAENTDGTGFKILHNFSSPQNRFADLLLNADGLSPNGLVLSGTTLYGTAGVGGINGTGTVFAVNTDGIGFTILHSFTDKDGSQPEGGLILSSNTLYGTTTVGGNYGWGTVFAVNTDGTGFTVMHSFTGGVSGGNPSVALISGNTLYGTTTGGGANGYGTIFSITLPVPAAILGVSNNATLTNSTNAFSWSVGSGVSQYYLQIGSTPGAGDVISKAEGTNTSDANISLPTDGRKIYVTLYSLINGVWNSSATTYTMIDGRAQLARPISGNPITNATNAFSWSAGTGVTQYFLQIGSSPGASDLISRGEGGKTNDTNVYLPTDGRTVYVTLYSQIYGVWTSTTSTFLTVDGRAALLTPTNNAVLTNSTNAFTWSVGTGVTQYYLQIGSTPGAGDLIAKGEGTNTSDTNVYLPTDGRTVYTTLWSQIYGVWKSNTPTTNTMTNGLASLITPTNNATLTNSTNAFTWSKGTGVTQYYLQIGSSPGAGDLISKGEGTNTSDTSVYLPTDGRTVYTTLWSQIYGTWKSNTPTTNTMTNGLASLITPTNNATLTNSTNAFTWSKGTGVTQYYLSVGNSTGASDIISRAEGMKTNDASVTLPTDGRTLYATLWSQIYGVWNSTSAVYTALDTKALLISPASGSTLTNTAISFTRSTATNATGYYLTVGSTLDGRDFYNNYFTGTNQLVTNLPADGRRIFVKLYSQVNGAWLYNGYTFNATTNGTSPKSVMVSPASGNTLTNASTTFTWSAGTGVSQYFIQVGTSLGAGDLISKSEGSNHSDTLSLPSDGKPLYVTLWSMIGGVWQSNSYLYNAFTSGSAQKALLASPVNGSIVKGNTLSLSWSAGSAASQYYLQVGSSFGAGDLFGQSLSTNTLSQSLAIPQDGRRLYVTLWSMISGTWQPLYYYFDTSK